MSQKKMYTDADIPVSQYPLMQAYKGDLFFQKYLFIVDF